MVVCYNRTSPLLRVRWRRRACSESLCGNCPRLSRLQVHQALSLASVNVFPMSKIKTIWCLPADLTEFTTYITMLLWNDVTIILSIILFPSLSPFLPLSLKTRSQVAQTRFKPSYSWEWRWIPDAHASTSSGMKLQVCAPQLAYSVLQRNPGLVYARQALYQQTILGRISSTY